MKTVSEITKAIKSKDFFFNTKSSTYSMIGDVLVRVSDHLPNVNNLFAYNEDVDKVFLIFAESDVTEAQVERYIDSQMRSYDVDFMIIDDTYDFSLEDILSAINRAF